MGPPRRLSENRQFVQNRGVFKKQAQSYTQYYEHCFLKTTKSLGEMAFSDRLLEERDRQNGYKLFKYNGLRSCLL